MNIYFLLGLLIVAIGMGLVGNVAATRERDRRRKQQRPE